MFSPQDQDNSRADARRLNRHHLRALPGRLRRCAAVALCAMALLLPLEFLGAASAGAATSTPQAQVTFTPLKLINGWTNTQFSTSHAAAAVISGIVHLKGAIATNGTNPVAFILPAAFRPATSVFVPVDMCGTSNGRLIIQHTGVVWVQPETSLSDAQCFTSLDGVSFARSASGFTPLKLVNGWTNAPFFTSKAAARVISGIVHLKGAIATSGNNTTPFILPAAFRPATKVFVPVDMCGAANGQLEILRNGVVLVEPYGSFSHAQCFTSLDGVSFARSASGFTSLKLVNGWTNAPDFTSRAAVRKIAGIVEFKGAIEPSASNPVAFTLPPGFRPATSVYVKVELCVATNGRLFIRPNGVVTVQTEAAGLCLTSLDGASFAL